MATRSKITLTTGERRLLVLVGLVVFILLNMWLVWPHAGDWKKFKLALKSAKNELEHKRQVVARLPELQTKVKEYEKLNPGLESHSLELLRTIQTKATLAKINITSYSPARTVTNEFFVEQLQTITVQGREPQIIEFLYQLGLSEALLRVRGLSLRPDATRQYLVGNITIAASYPRQSPETTVQPLTQRAFQKPSSPTHISATQSLSRAPIHLAQSNAPIAAPNPRSITNSTIITNQNLPKPR